MIFLKQIFSKTEKHHKLSTYNKNILILDARQASFARFSEIEAQTDKTSNTDRTQDFTNIGNPHFKTKR